MWVALPINRCHNLWQRRQRLPLTISVSLFGVCRCCCWKKSFLSALWTRLQCVRHRHRTEQRRAEPREFSFSRAVKQTKDLRNEPNIVPIHTWTINCATTSPPPSHPLSYLLAFNQLRWTVLYIRTWSSHVVLLIASINVNLYYFVIKNSPVGTFYQLCICKKGERNSLK